MGVPGLYRWLKRLRGCVFYRPPARVSCLIFDLNSLIHPVAQRVYAYGDFYDAEAQQRLSRVGPSLLEDELLREIVAEVMRLSRFFHPAQLVLAIDGVPPLAKVQQQRLRRFRSKHVATPGGEEEEEEEGGAGAAGGKKEEPDKGPPPYFDPNVITPGTGFMLSLDTFLRDRLAHDADLFNTSLIYYTGPGESGEGEHKLVDLLRDNRIGGPDAKLIHGVDADLIILSLLSDHPNIVLLRDTFQERGRRPRREYVDIDRLKDWLRNYLNTETALTDFALLSYMVGNDFAPRPVGAGNGKVSEILDIAAHAYRKLGKPLTQGLEINWARMAAIIARLAEEEPRLVEHTLQKSEPWLRRASLGPDGKSFDFAAFRSYWYRQLLGYDPLMTRREKRTYATLLGGSDLDELVRVDAGSVKQTCQEYLATLAWSLHYYVRGLEMAPAPGAAKRRPKRGAGLLSLTFHYPHLGAPLYSDMAIVAAKFPPDPRAHLAKLRRAESAGDRQFLKPPELLLAVIPPGSASILEKELRWLMTDTPKAALVTFEYVTEGLSGEERKHAAKNFALIRNRASRLYLLFRPRGGAAASKKYPSLPLSRQKFDTLVRRCQEKRKEMSPIFDYYPTSYRLENYTSDLAGSGPRIPLVSAERIRAAFELVRRGPATEKSLAPTSPLLLNVSDLGLDPEDVVNPLSVDRLPRRTRGAAPTAKKRRAGGTAR